MKPSLQAYTFLLHNSPRDTEFTVGPYGEGVSCACGLRCYLDHAHCSNVLSPRIRYIIPHDVWGLQTLLVNAAIVLYLK